jgi:hypothetical protein
LCGTFCEEESRVLTICSSTSSTRLDRGLPLFSENKIFTGSQVFAERDLLGTQEAEDITFLVIKGDSFDRAPDF